MKRNLWRGWTIAMIVILVPTAAVNASYGSWAMSIVNVITCIVLTWQLFTYEHLKPGCDQP